MFFLIFLSLFGKTDTKEYPYLVPYLKGDKWGFCDINKNIVVEPVYDDADLIKNERGWAKKENKLALIDLENGKRLTDFEFDDFYNRIEHGYIEVYKGNKYTLIDYKNGKPLTNLEFDDILPLIFVMDGPLFPYLKVEKDSLKGVIDTLGNIIVPLEYDRLSVASLELKEKFYIGEKNKKWWLISSMGKVLSNRGYDKIFPIWDSNFVEVELNGKVGYIDNTGEEITPFIYDREFIVIDGRQVHIPSSYVASNEKYREVKIKDKSGVINKKGKTVIPCIYDDMSSSFNNVFIAKRDGKIGGVDTNNQIVIPFEYYKYSIEMNKEYTKARLLVLEKNGKVHCLDSTLKKIPFSDYDDIEYLNDYQDYYGKDAFLVKKNEKFGIVDIKDSVIVPIEYEDIDGSYDEICSYITKKNGKYGLVILKNRRTIPPKYDNIKYFYKGLAEIEFNGKFGFIDTLGKEVIPPIYQRTKWEVSNSRAAVMQNDKWGCIDMEGKVIIPYIYNGAEVYDEPPMILINNNGKFAFFDIDGNQLTSFKYDDVYLPYMPYKTELFTVYIDKKEGLVDAKGDEVVPPIYDEIRGNYDPIFWVKKGKRSFYVKRGDLEFFDE